MFGDAGAALAFGPGDQFVPVDHVGVLVDPTFPLGLLLLGGVESALGLGDRPIEGRAVGVGAFAVKLTASAQSIELRRRALDHSRHVGREICEHGFEPASGPGELARVRVVASWCTLGSRLAVSAAMAPVRRRVRALGDVAEVEALRVGALVGFVVVVGDGAVDDVEPVGVTAPVMAT